MKNGAPRDELKNGRGRGWLVPYRRHRALINAILRCPGLRCMGLGLSQSSAAHPAWKDDDEDFPALDGLPILMEDRPPGGAKVRKEKGTLT